MTNHWITNNYHKLFKKYEITELKKDLQSDSFTKILEHYIKEIQYKATTKDLSPMEWLSNDYNVEKALATIKKNQLDRLAKGKNQFFKVEDSEIRNIQKYVEMWLSTTSDGHKVSNFNPKNAIDIYQRFTKPNDNVLDFSCGFASRLLASHKCNLNYYGIDVNKELIDKLNQMVFELDLKNINLYNTSSETFINELENKIDFIFTSPPYFNLEIYSKDNEQCMIKYKNYNDWLNYYVKDTLLNCYKYLKVGGTIAINIKNLTSKGKQPLYDDWLKIAKEVGFKYIETQEVQHKKRNQINQETNVAWKEPLIILRKE